MPVLKSFGALKGLRILDVTQALAGPFCTQMLAHHGADVIKIEPPKGGDMSRHIGPFTPDDKIRNYGGMYQVCNANKRGITLDLKNPGAKEVFLKLVEGADALVENFRSGVMERMGLGYEELAKINPRLVYTSIRGFGDPRGGKTEYTEWPAVDVIAQAMGGIMGITGAGPDDPTKVGGGPGDTVPGLYAAIATMIALWEARTSGKGQYVDVSMVDSVLTLAELITFYSYNDVVPRPGGNRQPQITPFGRVWAKDGWVVVAISSAGKAWADLCKIMGREDMIDDPRFSSNDARNKNSDAVYAAVEEFTGRHTKAELMKLLGGKIPFAPVYNAQEIHNDPHFKTRQMLVEVEQPGSEQKVTVAGVPPKLSRTPGEVHRRAPMLGEHTEEVLGELGLGADKIAQLRQSGAIA